MTGQFLEYLAGDTLLEAYVALPATEVAKRPAVLVCHAWAGRSAFECDKADKLAALGYVGIALDTYGKGVSGATNEECSALMMPLVSNRALLRSRLLAGLEAASAIAMVDTSCIAAIGYCFGGMCALDLARSGADLRGVVSFHGLFGAPGDLPNNPVKARILALHGHDDPMVPPDQVLALETELSAAGADWQIHTYGKTMHAFTNPGANAPDNGMQFNPVAANRAWQSMQNFLNEVLA